MISGFRSLSLITSILCLTSVTAAQDGQAAKPSVPVTIGIVVDCSGSQRLQLDRTISIVRHLAETLAAEDEAFIVKFVDSGKISIVEDFTSRKDVLQDAAEGLFVEGGLTALTDAVDFAARHFAESKFGPGERVRVMVLISDGDERKSAVRLDDAIAQLNRQKVRVFAIAVGDDKISTKLLDRFARESSGKVFVPRTTAEVSNSVIEIAAMMRGTSGTVK
jgi:VWFA-related protein